MADTRDQTDPNLFPPSVDIDQQSVDDLGAMHKQATDDIKKIVIGTAAAGLTVSAIRTARADIQARTQTLGNSVGEWIQTAIPAAYAQGQKDTMAQLKSFNNPLTDLVAANIIEHQAQTAPIHAEAIAAIQHDLSANFTGSLTGMARSADKVMAAAQHETVKAKFAALNEAASADSVTTRDLKNSILDSLDENGLFGIVDKSGRRWQADVYAENLARTSMVTARNTAMSNLLSSEKYDLVQVSDHGALDVCGEFEGQILSLNGKVEGYPTVDDATQMGLFHNNCKHSLEVCDPDQYPTDQLPYTADELLNYAEGGSKAGVASAFASAFASADDEGA